MIKNRNPDKATLAIGDGANDVNMICAAHVGVGISGLEGQQATKASDYAIGKFKYLKNLLFVHGREAYRRNSFAVVFIFYKNILISAPIFFFGIWSLFSGTMLYNLQLYNSFNPMFTSLPIIWFATMDLEVEKKELLSDPRLYKYGMRNLLFNYKILAKEIFYGFFQAFFIMVYGLYAMNQGSQSTHGMFGGYDEAGSFIFLTLVIMVNIRVLIAANSVDAYMIIIQFICFAMYVIVALGVNYTFYFDDQYMSYSHIFMFPSMYFSLFLFTIVFTGLDRFITFMRRYNKAQKLVAMENKENQEKEHLKQDPNQVRELLQTS